MPVHIVDDNDLVRECVSDVVTDAGYGASSFSGGRAYIDYMNSPDFIKPAMLITDMNMPCVNGSDLIKTVLEQHPDIAISIMSGHADHHAMAHELNINVLSKPFHPDTLVSLIHDVRHL